MIAEPQKALPWNPPNGHAVQLFPAGRWWDAVRGPTGLGEHTLKLLARYVPTRRQR